MSNSAFAAIALDLGTTSIKAGLLDHDGALSHVVSQPSPEMNVGEGRYESDALAYVSLAERVLKECLSQAGDEGRAVTNLGLCSQRSSFLIWDAATGVPVTPLISWQDDRGASSCSALQQRQELIRELSGLPLVPYYFAPKLRHVLQAHPAWRAGLESGEMLVGTLDTFLIWRWSSGRYFVTDASMAARTLLMDFSRRQWSPALCELFDIPMRILPDIRASAGMRLKLDNGLTLQASIGDQSGALLAGIAAEGAEALVNLGTGGFVVRYLAEGARVPQGYLRTLVYLDDLGQAHIACEGTLNSIAAALAPYPVRECQLGDLARDDIFGLAEPSGLGAPYFRSDLKVRFSGPVAHLPPSRIAALLLEAVIFRVALVLLDFHRAEPLQRVYLSGGLSELVCLQQGIAQCVPFDVYRLVQVETSLQGTALLSAGMQPGTRRATEKIKAVAENQALGKKFTCWQTWFADLLAS
ncbi:MAG: carbohydrate kinase [Nitrosomonadales bacterium]|nr:carbohydrate kinase [Nitrosomonadales bacterium]